MNIKQQKIIIIINSKNSFYITKNTYLIDSQSRHIPPSLTLAAQIAKTNLLLSLSTRIPSFGVYFYN